MQIALLVLALFSPKAHALDFLKCNSLGGKTLVVTFTRVIQSGEPAPWYYPSDIMVFKAPTELQDRVFINGHKKGRPLAVKASPVTLEFSFPAKGADGVEQTESISLRVYPRAKNAYIGSWNSFRGEKLEALETVNCSVY